MGFGTPLSAAPGRSRGTAGSSALLLFRRSPGFAEWKRYDYVKERGD